VALNGYITATQRLLHDPSASYFSLGDLTAYINEARTEIAIAGQCVRALISGSVASCAVANGGSGYSNPVVGFSSASGGVGAVATLTTVAGVIQSCTIIAPGSGFDAATATATIADVTGSGAVLVPSVPGDNSMVVGQEVYTFASRNPAAKLTAGVNAIHGVLSISASWGSTRPMLKQRTWTDFQAKWRSWSNGWLNNPIVWSQYGQGSGGTVYLAPIPSQPFNMDWDTYCTPLPLVDDTTPEAIPYPWTDCVKYYAAYLALDNAQRAPDADRMLAGYDRCLRIARAHSTPPFIPEPYED
jgi:hypothetical protein